MLRDVSAQPELRRRRLQPAADAHRRNLQRKARGIIRLDRNAAQRRDARRRLEPAGGIPEVKRRSGSSFCMPMMES